MKIFHLHRENTWAGICGGAHGGKLNRRGGGASQHLLARHSLYEGEGGISSRGPSFTNTKLHMHILGHLHGGRHICPLQSSLLVVLYTRRSSVGGVFPSVGQRVKLLILMFVAPGSNYSFAIWIL